MPSFQTTRATPYGPGEMLELVADVERYPEFVPLCEALRVLNRSRNPDGTETVTARMQVGYGPLHESFTSKVTVDRAKGQILVSYLDGPFRSLTNRWQFRRTPSGSVIDFYIAYEFRSLALQMLLGTMFDHAFRRFAAAFEERARRVYGPTQPGDAPALAAGKA